MRDLITTHWANRIRLGKLRTIQRGYRVADKGASIVMEDLSDLRMSREDVFSPSGTGPFEAVVSQVMLANRLPSHLKKNILYSKNGCHCIGPCIRGNGGGVFMRCDVDPHQCKGKKYDYCSITKTNKNNQSRKLKSRIVKKKTRDKAIGRRANKIAQAMVLSEGPLAAKRLAHRYAKFGALHSTPRAGHIFNKSKTKKQKKRNKRTKKVKKKI
tara:strand:- start:400 stop:1038 length:639 start_codon:yes stop_codon:yes gene_type:complete